MEPNMNSAAYCVAMENFWLMSLDQPTKDRLTYKTAAMEAATLNPESAGNLLQKLYRSIIGRSGINFGKVPDSKGDITKYTKYQTIVQCIDHLDQLLGDKQVEELRLTHKLLNILITACGDFEFGFKTDNQFIKTTYNTMVFALHEMVNICIVIYTDYLTASREGKPYKATTYRQDLIVVKNVKDFVRMYESGEWNQMIMDLKKGAKNLLGYFFETNNDVTTKTSWIHFIMSSLTNLGILAGGAKIMDKAAVTKFGVDTAASFGTKASTVAKAVWAKPVGKVGIIILALIAALILVRNLIALFYKGAYSIRDAITHEEEFLKAHAESEKREGNDFAYAFQSKFYTKMIALRDMIDNKILKDNANGKKEISEDNRTSYSLDEIRDNGPASSAPMSGSFDTGSFELV